MEQLTALPDQPMSSPVSEQASLTIVVGKPVLLGALKRGAGRRQFSPLQTDRI